MEEIADFNTKEDLDFKPKKGFWHLVAESDLFEMVEKSGFGEREFVLFQKRRLFKSILSMVGCIVPSLVLNKWFALTSVVFFIYTWRSSYTKEQKEYQGNVYEKQISWYVFQRLVVTYLKGSSDSFFEAFKKILDRLKEGEFKENLHRFIIDLTEDSETVEPYIHFAENAAGGTDSALTFMTALYNYQKHTHDGSVIDELSDVARREMMRGIQDIRLMKQGKFYLFPTKLTMLNVIPMIGFMAGAAYNMFLNHMNM